MPSLPLKALPQGTNLLSDLRVPTVVLDHVSRVEHLLSSVEDLPGLVDSLGRISTDLAEISTPVSRQVLTEGVVALPGALTGGAVVEVGDRLHASSLLW